MVAIDRMRTLSQRARAAWLVAALVALAFAQTLGAMHRVVHAPTLGPAALLAASAESAAGLDSRARADAVGAPVSALEALFTGHAAEHACDQYDQLTHADFLVGVHLPLPHDTAPSDTQPLHPGWRLAAQAAGFLARGPPIVL